MNEGILPLVAQMIGVAPSTMLMLVLIVMQIANVTARLIPNTATGTLGTIRQIASIVGVYVSSRVQPGVTIEDVAKAAAKTPTIAAKVEKASK